MTEKKESQPGIPQIDETDIVFRQIERINRSGGKIDKEEMKTDRGPQTWAHRYQSNVNELYSTVNSCLDDEDRKDIEKKLEQYKQEQSLKESNPFERKELFEKKKDLILKKLSEKNMIFETKTNFEITE